jgi:hypothetical protein
MENGPFIDGLPGFTELKNGGSFHGKLLVITRGYIYIIMIIDNHG